jgi:hypothetical protein
LESSSHPLRSYPPPSPPPSPLPSPPPSLPLEKCEYCKISRVATITLFFIGTDSNAMLINDKLRCLVKNSDPNENGIYQSFVCYRCAHYHIIFKPQKNKSLKKCQYAFGIHCSIPTTTLLNTIELHENKTL